MTVEVITREEMELGISEAIKPIEERIIALEGKLTPNEYLTIKETATLLGVTTFTVREYTKHGILTRYRVGSRFRYKSAEVIEAIEGKKNKQK